MADRFTIKVKCPHCGYEADNVLFAPKSDFIDWKCPVCGYVLDLFQYTDTSPADIYNNQNSRR